MRSFPRSRSVVSSVHVRTAAALGVLTKIRAKVLDLLGGYVSSPSITPEGIDSYIVPPALGVNSGVIGALLLGARALEREGER